MVTFLQNRTTDFDETLHVAWVCSGEGFGTSGRSGYSPGQKKAARGRLTPASSLKMEYFKKSFFLDCLHLNFQPKVHAILG